MLLDIGSYLTIYSFLPRKEDLNINLDSKFNKFNDITVSNFY